MDTKAAFITAGGICVARTAVELPYGDATAPLLESLDQRRGALFGSSYEIPGRYARSDIGFVDPPLAIESRGRQVAVTALNPRGQVLLPAVGDAIGRLDAVAGVDRRDARALVASLAPPTTDFAEEERSRQPSVFSVLRGIGALFRSPDPHLGLYGAFGYDLALQFEPLRSRLPRPAGMRDLVLYLPDELIVVDHRRERAERISYAFVTGGRNSAACSGGGRLDPAPLFARLSAPDLAPSPPGAFAAVVRQAKESFRRGDLFEVTPSHTLREPCAVPPSELFRRLRARNPAPYGFLINLGEGEHLVGASPEMYVRVQGDRVETCPIAGTIARGATPLADADQITRLLNSAKDQAELTMCTDVDRNDKSRLCVPGSVRVLARRQIELYARLIHTVDHVEGRLRPGLDALDAFLGHAWAVTVTGAPKIGAMQFIEDHESSARRWYGGAVGYLTFNGRLNTGITLRTIRVADGMAEVRVGATLLHDSDPDQEEQETLLKASALLDAIRRPTPVTSASADRASAPAAGKRVLMIDHADSFVHTLAGYLRQTGAEVVTRRAGFALELLDRDRPDLIVLSPGPGRPRDFALSATIDAALARGVPLFGVCLGLQGMVEHFGGRLHLLAEPVHGKASTIHVRGGRLFDGLPLRFQAGRYHSLYARSAEIPAALAVTAETDDGVVMALEHRRLPMSAVQFHPESIMTLEGDLGMALIRNVVTRA
jgi:anthranilate synthase